MDMRKKQYNTPLAARLEEVAERNHLSNSDMARIAGVSRSSVNAWYKRGTISKDSAAKIASATNVSLAWLLTGTEEKNTLGLDEDELALLETYRAMPPIEQRNMLAAFQMRLQQLKEFYANYADPTTRQK
ncbi:helix-turn-helix domain-containing protein [Salmonella enterica]|uniref:Helix-turn-helix domain-containing protein n=6 Tax=Enterobacteriaceae TaxID=543 RepID=A0A5W3HZ20_SALNE|nr:helix-turn-helix domain-containing protein [Salmonella enterica subsp. enterica serovar Typhimurium]EAA3383769.1 helix-turn-helix domain-containing protein [Salmonella enterica]EAA4488130.1 helix-turn-helix domain-containing protein [Salmonella enterica subsp. enterica]EAA5348445.1 helix-turn-helix domain-containing protein [Salmonella enterica subsp. enterica serovar Litchfield]EAA5686803.1 helix-turn-helix domain-containing protein [Salmonella enterica subsp. enterica serovar Newport]EAA6